MGIGDSWGTREELLHPRDKNGRFRSKWKMASGVVNAILKALSSFSPRTFSSDGEAGQYLFNHAKPSRFRGGSDFKALTGFAQANKNLRAGSMDAETKKFVQVMDESSVNLPDDVILSKVVGPQAFGLTPETVGLDEGGIEDFTGKLIGDRGYNSAMIGTPGRKQPGQIEMRIAVPKGTKAVIPATSRGDREVILDKDQELRVTKVTPDGQGGYYVLAVAQPRTPGDTPEPVGTPAPAPGTTPAPGVPGDVQSDNAPDPRAMVQQPGAPPPRTEPEVTPSLGGGPSPAAGPGGPPVAPDQGAPGAPAVDVPAVPQAPRIVDLRAAVREAQLPVPSRGKRRRDWDQAYYKLASPKPANPDDVLRELDKDIEVHRQQMADLAQGGDSDPLLADDVEALEGLRDLIREKYDRPAAAPDPAAPIKKAAPVKVAPVKKAAPAAPRTQAGLPKLERPPPPAKKAAPERAPGARGTTTEGRRQAALEAAKASPITGAEGNSYRNIVKGLEDGDLTPAAAAKRARDSAAHFRKSAATAGNFSRPNETSREVERRKATVDRINALADRYEKLSTDVKLAGRHAASGHGRMLKSEMLAEARQRGIEIPPSWTKERIGAVLRGEEPAPTKKAAPAKKAAPVAKVAKAAVPGSAPGTAAGKITAARLQPGTRILVAAESNGRWLPTNRKTDSLSVEVVRVDRVQGGTTPGGRGTSRARIRVTTRDELGRETATNVSPSQTLLVQPATAATPAPERAAPVAAFPKDEGAAVNMRRPLRRGERNEMADIIDRLVADGNTIPGFAESLGGRGSVKRNLEDLSEELRSSKKLTTFDVSLITDSVFQRLGLGRTQGVFNDKERLDIELRDFLAERLPAIKNVATGENTPAAKAARTKVDGPKATTPVLAPDRQQGLRDAVTKLELNFETGSVKRQTNEILDDIESGKLTPEEGIRRLETEITINKDELADLDRAIREESSQELKRIGVERRQRLARSIKEQERASAGLRKHFGKEPTVTTDEVVINLTPEQGDALNKATLADLKKAAEGLGIKVTGRTKKQFLDALLKKMAEKELERRGLLEKAPAPKAADGPAEDLPAAKWERVNVSALAEGLGLDTRAAQERIERLQKDFDEEKLTPKKIAEELRHRARMVSWGGVVEKQVGIRADNDPDRNEAARVKGDKILDEGRKLRELADRIEKVRRRRPSNKPEPEKPKLSAPEKAEIRQVAELTDIPAETLAKKALAKKKADAPPPRTARQVADTLATVSGEDEVAAILKGHTKAELLDIAKVMDVDVRPSATKPKIMAAISDRVTVGSAFKVLTRGGFRTDAPAPSGGALTRAQLKEMTIPEIKALEDQLGIKRTSVARDDRIDAILKAQGGAPKAAAPAADMDQKVQDAYRDLSASEGSMVSLASLRERIGGTRQEQDEVLIRLSRERKIRLVSESDQASLTQAQRDASINLGNMKRHHIVVEGAATRADAPEAEAARARQADIDQARKIGNVAGEWIEILNAGASDEAILARLRAAEAREGIDLSRVIQSVENGDMRQAAIRMESLVNGANLIRRGDAGKIQQYHAASDQLLPGETVGPSGRVRVLRPGYTLKRGDEVITLSRPIVVPVDEPDVDSPAPAPEANRPKKGLQAGATRATDIKVPAGFEAWFRDGRKRNVVIYDKDRNPVATVSPISVKVDAEEGGGQEDVQERFYGSLWGQPNTNTGSIRSQADAVKAALDMMKRDQPSKLSTKPILENTWGGRRSEIHFHADGAIGMGLSGLKEDDRRLEVNGDALENVIGRIATDLVTGQITGDEQIDRLRDIAAGLPDGPAKRAVSRMVTDLDAPRREAIKVPDAGQYTGVLQELMNKLLQIPLARGGSRADRRREFNEVDLLLDHIKEMRTTRAPSILAEDLLQALHNKRHESMEGKMAIDRAVVDAMNKMRAMKRQPS